MSRTFLLLLLLLFSQQVHAAKPDSYFSAKRLSYTWMYITNPIESLTHTFFRNSTALEQQHVVPQSNGESALGRINDFTVYWVKSNHSISDRTWNKPFLTDRDDSWLRRNFILSFLTLGNDRSQESLDTAYLMGAYGRPYSLMFHDYSRDKSILISAVLDGPSVLVYGVSWLVNIPQKFVNHIAYIIKKDSEPNIFYLIDVVVSVVVYMVDCVLCVMFTVLGFFIGCLLHPISSVCSLGGMIYYILPVAWTAVSELVFGVTRVLFFWS